MWVYRICVISPLLMRFEGFFGIKNWAASTLKNILLCMFMSTGKSLNHKIDHQRARIF